MTRRFVSSDIDYFDNYADYGDSEHGSRRMEYPMGHRSDSSLHHLTARFDRLNSVPRSAPEQSGLSQDDMKQILVPRYISLEDFQRMSASGMPVPKIYELLTESRQPAPTHDGLRRNVFTHPADPPVDVLSDSGVGTTRRRAGMRRSRDTDEIEFIPTLPRRAGGDRLFSDDRLSTDDRSFSADRSFGADRSFAAENARMARLKEELDQLKRKLEPTKKWSVFNPFSGLGSFFAGSKQTSPPRPNSHSAWRQTSSSPQANPFDASRNPLGSRGRREDRIPRGERSSFVGDTWKYLADRTGFYERTGRYIPQGVFIRMKDGASYVGNTLGDFYDRYEEGRALMNISVIYVICLFMFGLLISVYAIWFAFFSVYIALDLIKTLTLTFFISVLARYRISSGYLFIAGLFASILMHQIQYDPYVHIPNDKFSNCRVYQSIDKCMRDSPKKQVIMTGFFLLEEIMRHCLVDVHSTMCREAKSNVHDSLDFFHKCARKTVLTPSLVEGEPVQLQLYQGGLGSNQISIHRSSLSDMKLTEKQRIYNMYYLLAFRLDEGYFWENDNRMELARENFKNKTDNLASTIFEGLRSYGTIGMPDFLIRALLLLGLIRDLASKVFAVEPSKFDIFDFLVRTNHRKMNKELHRIQHRQVIPSTVQIQPVLKKPGIPAHVVLSKYKNLTQKVLNYDGMYIGSIDIPAKQRMGDVQPMHDDPIDDDGCDNIERLQTLNWNFHRCQLLPQVFVAAAEMQFGTQSPEFCPTYCAQTVFETSRQDLLLECRLKIEQLNEEKSQCSQNNVDQAGLYQIELSRLKEDFETKLQNAKEECRFSTCETKNEVIQEHTFQTKVKETDAFEKLEEDLNALDEKNKEKYKDNTIMYVIGSVACFGLCVLCQIILCCCGGRSVQDNSDAMSTRTSNSIRAAVADLPADQQERTKKFLKEAEKNLERRRSGRLAEKSAWGWR